MTPIAATIRILRNRRGLSLTRLAELAGCSKAYLSEIENDRHDNPPSRALLSRIEAALQAPPDSLTSLADWHQTPPSIRQHIRRLTHELDRTARRPDGSLDLDRLLRHASPPADDAPRNLQRPALPSHPIPVINKVAAGYPTDFTDLDYPARFADDYVTAPLPDDPDAFAARVVGDSMAPDYQQGDIVVFSTTIDPQSGSDCFVRILPDHQSTFKRIFFEPDDRIRLQPINPDYQPRILHRSEIDGLYPSVYRVQPIPRPAGT